MTWVGPLVGTQWSATPIDAPSAPSQVPSEKTTQNLEPMAPGRLEPDASTLSRFRSDGLNDAQTSELGRLSSGKGGLPLGLFDPALKRSACRGMRVLQAVTKASALT